jgi:hypothetical protein
MFRLFTNTSIQILYICQRTGVGKQSKHFLNNITKYNSAFQMTSFGVNKVQPNGYNPTFRIKSQIHNYIGSILPVTRAS